MEKQREYQAGNSQLIIDYRATLLKAFDLGEEIKKLYGIQPPKAIHTKHWDSPVAGIRTNPITVGLTVA